MNCRSSPKRNVRRSEDSWLNSTLRPGSTKLTEEEKGLIDSRLDDCDRNPDAFIPWDEAKALINASLKEMRFAVDVLPAALFDITEAARWCETSVRD